jgi:hypothetical protein
MDRIPIDYCRGCDLLDACKVFYRATEPPCARNVEAVDNSAQHTQLAIAARVLLDVYDGQSDLGFVPAIYDLRAALQQQASA